MLDTNNEFPRLASKGKHLLPLPSNSVAEVVFVELQRLEGLEAEALRSKLAKEHVVAGE